MLKAQEHLVGAMRFEEGDKLMIDESFLEDTVC